MSDLPARTADTMSLAISMSSPSGRTGKRAHATDMKRLELALFGEGGLADAIRPKLPPQPSKAQTLRAHAAQLREIAGRGMSVRKYTRKADELEAEALRLESETK